MPSIAARRVVTGTDHGRGRAEARALTLEVVDGRIVEVREGIDPQAELIEGWIVPGFVDVHCHGAAGYGFGSADAAGVQAAIDYHRSHGSTSLYASTVTEELAELRDQVQRIGALVRAGELDGIHLEGPYLSPRHKGAHDESLLRAPDSDSIAELIAAGEGSVAMVTLAPELPGGIEAIGQFTAQAVVVAFGHTDADESTVRTAIDAGATTVTHLFNAMCGIHHRKPGPIPWLLTDERVMVELICDGTHLHADTVRLAIEAAGIDRVALITDAMAATGNDDGHYILGTLQVEVIDGVARVVVDGDEPGPIAGSTLTMAGAVAFVVTQVGCTIPEAAVMAATTPARWHHLDQVGELAPGRRANLCVLDDQASLVAVMRDGSWLAGAGRSEADGCARTAGLDEAEYGQADEGAGRA